MFSTVSIARHSSRCPLAGSFQCRVHRQPVFVNDRESVECVLPIRQKPRSPSAKRAMSGMKVRLHTSTRPSWRRVAPSRRGFYKHDPPGGGRKILIEVSLAVALLNPLQISCRSGDAQATIIKPMARGWESKSVEDQIGEAKLKKRCGASEGSLLLRPNTCNARKR